MRLNCSQVTLITVVGILLYLNSLTVAVEAVEAKDYYGKAKVRQRSSLLDTFSLSFVGNFDFSQIIDGLKKIFEGFATCKISC